MKRSAIRLAIILTAACSAMAQEPTSVAKNDFQMPRLKIAEAQELHWAKEGSIFLPAKCDQEGNLYLRFYAGTKALKAPLRKFSPQGNEIATYSLPSDPSFQAKGAGVLDFSIGKNGRVFLLTVSEDGFYVLKYNNDGTLASRIKLQTRFTPSRFQPFDSGEFLVTGVGRGTEASPSHAIVTAIFTPDGSWTRRIELPQEKAFEEAADRGDADFIEPGEISASNLAVERGHVIGGADGNVYVARWTYPAKIAVIAPSGEVVRSFDVKPPLERRKPDALFTHGSRLALEYSPAEPGQMPFIMLVGTDGQDYGAYDFSGAGSNLVCYGEQQGATLFNGKSFLFARLP